MEPREAFDWVWGDLRVWELTVSQRDMLEASMLLSNFFACNNSFSKKGVMCGSILKSICFAIARYALMLSIPGISSAVRMISFAAASEQNYAHNLSCWRSRSIYTL